MNEVLPFVFCLGANHISADIEFREKLYLTKDSISMAMPKILEKYDISEAFILSTCNRLEFYGAVHKREISKDELLEVFVDLQWLCHEDRVEKAIIEKNSYIHTSMPAIEHLFTVASGLDSLVIGETQITGQFKDAVKFAKESGFIGPILNRLEQEALKTSKKVRTYTDIGKKTVSISHAAVDLSFRLCGGIDDQRVAIIGAGEMARVAGQYLLKHTPVSFTIMNRTLEKANELVEKLGFGQARSILDMEKVLIESDVVISSTSKDGYVLEKEVLKSIQKKRENRPLYIIDIALPRDIDPKCADLEDVYVFDIDDLKQIVDENLRGRKLAAEKAKGIVIESSVNFRNWIDALSLKNVTSDFKIYLDGLIFTEAKKTLSRAIYGSLEEGQKNGIYKLLESISGKITRDLVISLKNPKGDFDEEQLARSVKTLFPLNADKSNNITENK